MDNYKHNSSFIAKTFSFYINMVHVSAITATIKVLYVILLPGTHKLNNRIQRNLDYQHLKLKFKY
jgi:hypothetical protein